MLLTSLVQLASALAEEIEILRLQRDEAVHVLNAVFLAIALLDRNGSVVYVNDKGRRLLSAPKGLLRFRHGRIIARQPDHQEAFRRFLQLASQAAENSEQHDDSLLLRSANKEAASLSVRIVGSGAVAGHPSSHYLFAAKTVGTNEHIFEISRRLFNLTDAEARIAAALADGLSLTEAATLLDIKVSTARTHLARVFQKTHTQQQSQLVSILQDTMIPIQC